MNTKPSSLVECPTSGTEAGKFETSWKFERRSIHEIWQKKRVIILNLIRNKFVKVSESVHYLFPPECGDVGESILIILNKINMLSDDSINI